MNSKMYYFVYFIYSFFEFLVPFDFQHFHTVGAIILANDQKGFSYLKTSGSAFKTAQNEI